MPSAFLRNSNPWNISLHLSQGNLSDEFISKFNIVLLFCPSPEERSKMADCVKRAKHSIIIAEIRGLFAKVNIYLHCCYCSFHVTNVFFRSISFKRSAWISAMISSSRKSPAGFLLASVESQEASEEK